MRHTWSEWSLITAAVICRVRLSSGDRSLPRACTLVSSWVQEGCVEGAAAAPVHGWRARMPGRLIPEVPWPEGGRSRWKKPPPLALRTREGSACGPPDSAPYLDPSFQNTAPPSQPAQHNEDTRSPVSFGHFNPLWILLFYYFCWIKASPRPDATPTVSVVCSSRHNTHTHICTHTHIYCIYTHTHTHTHTVYTVYIHTHTHTHTHIYIHTHTHTHIYCIYTHTHTHKHTFIHTHTHTHTHTYIYIYTHTHICTHTHIYIYTHTYTHTHTHTHTYMYTHTHTHTHSHMFVFVVYGDSP